jgi:fatty acid desaturase
MARKYSRGERREKLKERYRTKREKVFSIIFTAIIFLALLGLLAYGFWVEADPFLLIVLVIIILVLVPFSVFFMDVVHWEI